jgi:Secretion system C-terminal sorting domain
VITVPSGITVNSTTIGDITVVNGVMYVYINSVGLLKFNIPASSATTATATLVGSQTTTATNRVVGSTYYLSSDPGYLYGYGSAAGTTAQDRLLKIDIATGAVTELTPGGGFSTSQSDGAGCFTGTFYYSLSGNVFNDVNGSTGGVDGAIYTAGGLWANLIDNSGKVIARVPVGTDGKYKIDSLLPGSYTIQLNTTAGTIGSVAPTQILPTGWANTGDAIGVTLGSTPNGVTETITFAAADLTNVNFGINQIPESAINVQLGRLNPGGTNSVTIPGSAFSISTASGAPNTQDYSGGTVVAIEITTFPSNATSITIAGVKYTTLAAIKTAYPNGIPTDANGVPSVSIAIDPIDGLVSVVIPFVSIDNAGNKDLTPGSVTIPFTSMVPIIIESITVNNTINCAAILNWKTGVENNFKHFEIEYSDNSIDFKNIGIIESQKIVGARYEFNYSKPAVKTTYYRLKMVDIDGSYSYSATLKLQPCSDHSQVILYPNPVKNVLNVNGVKDLSKLEIFTKDGKLILSNSIDKLIENVNVSKLASGFYVVRITNINTNEVQNFKIIKE